MFHCDAWKVSSPIPEHSQGNCNINDTHNLQELVQMKTGWKI